MAIKKNGKFTNGGSQVVYKCPNPGCDKVCKRREGITRHKKSCCYAPPGQQRTVARQLNQQQRVEFEHEIEYDGGLGNIDFDNDLFMEDGDDVGDREIEKLLDHTIETPKNVPEQDWSLLRLQRDFHLSNPELSAISKCVF
jgi:hypothetical protein